MIPRLDLGRMGFLLGHPRRGDAFLGLLACCTALGGFWLGVSQSGLDREEQRLTVVAGRLETVLNASDGGWGDDAMDAERVLGELVDGVEGARAWVRSLRQAASDAGFGIRLRWGDSVRPMPGWPQVEHVQVVIEVDSSSMKQGAITRMEGFLQHLGTGSPPFDLSRVRWIGSGRGLTGVVVEGRLWVRKLES